MTIWKKISQTKTAGLMLLERNGLHELGAHKIFFCPISLFLPIPDVDVYTRVFVWMGMYVYM